MNERIKELAEQAGPLQDVLSEIYGGTPGRYVRNKALLDFQLEKFAELIIRECTAVVFKNTGPRSALNVLEHFELKE